MKDMSDKLRDGRRAYGAKNADGDTTEYPCPACSKKFDDEHKFIAHMKITHHESGEMAIARARGIESPEAYS